MKKNTKKTASKTKAVKPAVLRMVNPGSPEKTVLKNLPIRPRVNRLPAQGSAITKTYHGQTFEVKVLENSFEYQGKTYKSISRVAIEIVKRPISGYVFFGLTK